MPIVLQVPAHGMYYPLHIAIVGRLESPVLT